MRRNHRIAVSAAVTTGVIGVAGAALAAIPGMTPVSAPTSSDTTNSQAAEASALLESQALLRDRSETLRLDLLTAQKQLSAAKKAAAAQAVAQARAARRSAQAKATIVYVHATRKVAKPVTHTTTGASGATGGEHEDDHEGGSDD